MKLAAMILATWTALSVVVALPLGRLLGRRSDEMRKLDDERGAVAVMAAILIPVVLIGVLSLVVDLGGQVAARRSMVTAADAAALAAAQACALPATAGGAETAADELAAANVSEVGILSGITGGIVKSEGCGSPIGAVRVTYSATASRAFAGVLGVGPGTVTTTATASWSTTVEGGGDPVVGNGDANGGPQGNTQGDPNAVGQDCTHNAVGGPTPGGNVNHCPEPTVEVRLVG